MYHRINDMFKAFADENRLRILNLLSKGELCVCDITSVLKMGQSRVSRHLSYLRNSGLVECRREGLWMHYSIKKPQGNFHQRLIECLRDCFDEADILKKDMKALEKSNVKRC